jgi:hypothetical protein
LVIFTTPTTTSEIQRGSKSYSMGNLKPVYVMGYDKLGIEGNREYWANNNEHTSPNMGAIETHGF